MNFLAHMYLTYPAVPLSAGNLVGDFIKARDVIGLPPAMQRGVLVHRKIDTLADSHASVREIVGALRSRHGKYAPVVLDILFDYILCDSWKALDPPCSLDDFLGWSYGVLRYGMPRVPDSVGKRLARMNEYRWFDSYATIAGMRQVLAGMDRRARFPSNFADGIDDIARFRKEMDIAFQQAVSDIRIELNK